MDTPHNLYALRAVAPPRLTDCGGVEPDPFALTVKDVGVMGCDEYLVVRSSTAVKKLCNADGFTR